VTETIEARATRERVRFAVLAAVSSDPRGPVKVTQQPAEQADTQPRAQLIAGPDSPLKGTVELRLRAAEIGRRRARCPIRNTPARTANRGLDRVDSTPALSI